MQDYAKAHVSIVDAVAGLDLQQVSWYACTVAANDMATVLLASMLARGCLLLSVDDDDSSFYGAVMLMKPDVAAGHILTLSAVVTSCRRLCSLAAACV